MTDAQTAIVAAVAVVVILVALVVWAATHKSAWRRIRAGVFIEREDEK